MLRAISLFGRKLFSNNTKKIEKNIEKNVYLNSISKSKQYNNMSDIVSIGNTSVNSEQASGSIQHESSVLEQDTEYDTDMTPWKVGKTVNYEKIMKFGAKKINAELIERWERVTRMKAHPWIRRGIFFAHKDLELILDQRESGEQVFLYTGRGPSSEALHMGHMVPFKFTQYLQQALSAILVIQLSDDEKYAFKKEGDVRSLSEYYRLGMENAKDIIACGFDIEKTYIFSNMQKFGNELYRISWEIASSTTCNQIRGIFGINLENTVAQMMWPAMQCAPAYYQAFPGIVPPGSRCLVPMAIDQAPYFNLARDFVDKSGDYLKPSTIYSQFLPALGGDAKASSTDVCSPIFMTDTEEEVRSKIKRFAFSGGGKTRAEHELYGGNLEADIPYQYLLYFLEDDEELKHIATEYRYGRMLSGKIKEIASDVIWKYISEHQQRREQVTDEVVRNFMDADHTMNYCVYDRPEIELEPSEKYNEYGLEFDRYFGLPGFGKLLSEISDSSP